MKKIRKFGLKIVSIALIIILSVFVLTTAIKTARDYEIYKEPSIETKIYIIWHIETFEGGGQARINYLKNIARLLEKQNDGLLFYIRTIKPENLRDELDNSLPDIISFGYGVGDMILSELSALELTYDVRDELVDSGSFNNKVYALPYIMSGYAVMTHGAMTDNFHSGSNGYTSARTIAESMSKTIAQDETQYEAYKEFVYNKDVTLLGSARDVFRVNNLNNIGRTNASISPVDSYTDLIQYIGLINNDDISQKFLSMILEDEHQMKLSEYSLFSSKYNKIYSTGIYNDMEDAIFSCVIPSAFK